MQLARIFPQVPTHRRASAYGVRVARRDPRRFGRRAAAVAMAAPVQPSISDDLKLFALTFAGGFLFVSILIG